MRGKLPGRVAAGALAVGLGAGCYWGAPKPPAGDPPAAPTQPATGLFASWPAGKPQLTLVLSGQMYGYLSPCGCSSPQKGGLERRANLMDSLRGRGWEVVGLDLGDLATSKGVVPQDRLKYRTTMKALGSMGYAAVGLGESEFKAGLFDLLAEFALNNPGKPPIILADNLVGTPPMPGQQPVPREKLFPNPAGGRPQVDGVEVVVRPGAPALGIVAVVGPDEAQKVGKLDGQFKFLDNPAVLKAALQRLDAHPAKPPLRVLLYNGPLDQAKAAAAMFPQFQLILCQSEDPEPPNLPTMAGGTTIVQIGHKGMNVGVVGVFPAAGGKFDLRYERVTITEQFLTPPGEGAEKNHAVLKLMQEYADEVKRLDSLGLFKQKATPHPSQVKAANLQPPKNLTYVGSDACKACHPAEFQKYTETKHSHAYQALSEVAKRPSGRQFDGECIVCHTVGFEHPSGYENAEKTAHLKNVGCESCHGPGSGHVAAPADKDLLMLQSPWKAKPEDKLPDLKDVQKLAEMKPLERGQVPFTPAQKLVEIQVNNLCQKCHDLENDPHFDLWKYLPKIWHRK